MKVNLDTSKHFFFHFFKLCFLVHSGFFFKFLYRALMMCDSIITMACHLSFYRLSITHYKNKIKYQSLQELCGRNGTLAPSTKGPNVFLVAAVCCSLISLNDHSSKLILIYIFIYLNISMIKNVF